MCPASTMSISGRCHPVAGRRELEGSPHFTMCAGQETVRVQPGCNVMFLPNQPCRPKGSILGLAGCCTPGFQCKTDAASVTGSSCQAAAPSAQTFAFARPADVCATKVQPNGQCGASPGGFLTCAGGDGGGTALSCMLAARCHSALRPCACRRV